MQYHPMPVIIVSSLTPTGCQLALKALKFGAVEVMHKPQVDSPHKLREVMILLIDKIKAVALIRANIQDKKALTVKIPPRIYTKKIISNKIIAIGASTGGAEAIRAILSCLPINSPPIVIVQHMPERFTKAFAESLDKQCQIEVREAKDRDELRPGLALIAKGDRHLILCRNGLKYFVELNQGPLVCRQRPSVEILFNSVAKCAQKNAIGVILSGMGNDGAKGLLNMRKQGAFTIAQDKESCVVYGMPREAVKLQAVNKEIPLSQIPAEIIRQCQ